MEEGAGGNGLSDGANQARKWMFELRTLTGIPIHGYYIADVLFTLLWTMEKLEILEQCGFTSINAG